MRALKIDPRSEPFLFYSPVASSMLAPALPAISKELHMAPGVITKCAKPHLLSIRLLISNLLYPACLSVSSCSRMPSDLCECSFPLDWGMTNVLNATGDSLH